MNRTVIQTFNFFYESLTRGQTLDWENLNDSPSALVLQYDCFLEIRIVSSWPSLIMIWWWSFLYISFLLCSSSKFFFPFEFSVRPVESKVLVSFDWLLMAHCCDPLSAEISSRNLFVYTYKWPKNHWLRLAIVKMGEI